MREELSEINTFKLSVEAQIQESIECPKCHHKFHLRDEKFDFEQAKKKLPECDELIKECEDEIEELKKQKEELKTKQAKEVQDFNLSIQGEQKEITKIDQSIMLLRTDLKTRRESLKSIKAEKDSLERSIKSLKMMINNKKEDIQEQQTSIKAFEKTLNEIQGSRSNKKEKLKEVGDKIILEEGKLIEPNKKKQECEEYIEKRTKWRLNFKKFKSYLANTAISAIQDQTNYYLERMGTNLEVMIDGYRELSNGDLKEEISLLISRDGLEGEKPGKFSGGEKSKCDLASIIGMQTLINQSSPTGGLNFTFIDEILESNDDVALSYIIKGLNNINRTILLITHVGADNLFQDCNGLIVEKRDKISTIKMAV